MSRLVTRSAAAHDVDRCHHGAPSHERWSVRAIRWYQRGAEGRPSPCRFFPSCSSYALESLERHGTARGLWLTVRRLLRCRPFGPSGFDPVPDPRVPRQEVR